MFLKTPWNYISLHLLSSSQLLHLRLCNQSGCFLSLNNLMVSPLATFMFIFSLICILLYLLDFMTALIFSLQLFNMDLRKVMPNKHLLTYFKQNFQNFAHICNTYIICSIGRVSADAFMYIIHIKDCLKLSPSLKFQNIFQLVYFNMKYYICLVLHHQFI